MSLKVEAGMRRLTGRAYDRLTSPWGELCFSKGIPASFSTAFWRTAPSDLDAPAASISNFFVDLAR